MLWLTATIKWNLFGKTKLLGVTNWRTWSVRGHMRDSCHKEETLHFPVSKIRIIIHNWCIVKILCYRQAIFFLSIMSLRLKNRAPPGDSVHASEKHVSSVNHQSLRCFGKTAWNFTKIIPDLFVLIPVLCEAHISSLPNIGRTKTVLINVPQIL